MAQSQTRPAHENGRDRRAAIIAGVVFIIATAGAIASVPLLPSLAGADYLTGVSDHSVQLGWGAILLLVAAFGSAGIAVAIYPVMKRFGPTLALASVVFRTMEGMMYVLAVVFLLSLATLGHQFAAADAAGRPALQAIGDMLRGARDHASVAGVFAFCVGAFCYYLLFFQSRLVPRWLSGFGLVAIALMFVAAVMALLSDSAVTSYVLFALPIIIQEMVLAVWLIVWGFDLTAEQPASARA